MYQAVKVLERCKSLAVKDKVVRVKIDLANNGNDILFLTPGQIIMRNGRKKIDDSKL